MLKWPRGQYSSRERAWKLFLCIWLQSSVLCWMGCSGIPVFVGSEHRQPLYCLYWTALWSMFNKVDESLSCSTWAFTLTSAGCVFVLRWTAPGNPKHMGRKSGPIKRLALSVILILQYLLDSFSDKYWMFFLNTLYIQGVLFSKQKYRGEILWLVYTLDHQMVSPGLIQYNLKLNQLKQSSELQQVWKKLSDSFWVFYRSLLWSIFLSTVVLWKMRNWLAIRNRVYVKFSSGPCK